MMNILILGNGGREHAFAWKMKQSPLAKNIFIAPGNAGTSLCGTNVDLQPDNFEGIKKFCLDNGIDLVIPGPEDPLVKGIVDEFEFDEFVKSIPVIGPTAKGAQLEGSKAFAKEFMIRHHIPTAAYREFGKDSFEEGLDYLRNHSTPIVLKADGLAAGKGVLICQTNEEALTEFSEMIQHSKFGPASEKVVVEEFLTGIEASIFVLTDGINYKLLPEAKDYKRIGEGDTGLNTGGMGAVSPVPFIDKSLKQKIEERIVKPTILGLRNDGIKYRGFIFIGLMIQDGDPSVIEYNCRMGDPETEVVLPRLRNDLVALLNSVANQTLNEQNIDISPDTAVGIVAVSKGYPGAYEKGKVINGLEAIAGEDLVFHAGTSASFEKVVTNGGRVLVSVSLGQNVKEAVKLAENSLQKIDFEGKNYRRDIGYEFL